MLGNLNRCWCNVVPIYSFKEVVDVFNELDASGQIVTKSLGISKSIELFESLEENNRTYKYKKQDNLYKNYIGHQVTVAVPRSFKGQFIELIDQVAKLITGDEELPYFGYASIKGTAVYVHVFIGQRQFYKKAFDMLIHEGKDVYKSSKTNKFCKPDDPYAVLFKKKGEVRTTIQSNWGKKVRLFEMPKKKFREWRENFLEIIAKLALINLNNSRLLSFVKSIKHKNFTKNGNQRVFINVNVNLRNTVTRRLNCDLTVLHKMIYSDTKYYQDNELVMAFNRLINYVKSIFNKKTVKRNNLDYVINEFIRSDVFSQNLESIMGFIRERIKEFMEKHIYDHHTIALMTLNNK